ncbi:MAG: choline-sulfatase [Gammaproteobacteria bacterium]|nr:choline-sulfatase [Gammaproteobacteria bacterium]
MSKQPNFLLIMADQLAAPALPSYGNQTAKTPTLSKLANESVLFENCYCNYPICGPSRASMHTGRLAFDMQMYDNASEFPSSIPTFAHYLRSMGYQVEMSGKMHFVGPDQLHGYHKRHTTEIYPANYAWTVDWRKGREFRPTNLTMAPVIESGPCIRSLQVDYDEEVAYYGQQAIYDLARRNDDRPFMLTVSFTQPHSPFVAPQKYWDLYNHEDIELPNVPAFELDAMDHLSRNLHYCQGRHEFTVTDEHRRNARHGYYGMISYIDDKVAQLLDALEKSDQRDNTVVIFCADHGEMMGERGMWYKQHFFEWASNVPLIVSMPNNTQSGRVQSNVTLLDLMPTLLDLANGAPFDGYVNPIQGKSLVPFLDNPNHQSDTPIKAEFAADGSTGPSRMVKQNQYKYMDLEGVDELLYDLDTDPDELTNLINHPEYQSIAEALRHEANAMWDREATDIAIRQSQQNRILVHRTTGGDPTYVYGVQTDDHRRYVRNDGAADTKARARLPKVAAAKPDLI